MWCVFFGLFRGLHFAYPEFVKKDIVKYLPLILTLPEQNREVSNSSHVPDKYLTLIVPF